MKRRLLALLLLANVTVAAPLFSAGPVAAAPAADGFSDPAMETRARNLQRQFRCLVCQGQSIDESDAPLAADLRHLVRRLMAEGRSDAQISDYLKARYGNFILMRPPVEPATWLLWLAPLLVLAAAGGVAWRVVSKARNAPESLDSENISNL